MGLQNHTLVVGAAWVSAGRGVTSGLQASVHIAKVC